jgi:hypothetical protein
MREIRQSGSVRGADREVRPYRDNTSADAKQRGYSWGRNGTGSRPLKPVPCSIAPGSLTGTFRPCSQCR